MKSFSNAISRRFVSLSKTRKFSRTPKSRPATPVINASTTPIADALESSPRYLNMSPLNKTLPKLP